MMYLGGMTDRIKIRQLERKLFAAFDKAGFELYLVGGVVRDRILSRNSRQDDLDFATSARPADTKRILEDLGFRTWDVGAGFGTISAMHTRAGVHRKIEITTFRAEVYRKRSRKPEVVFGKSLEEDLRRRDFTINAMAADAGGVLVDPFGGRGDISAGVIRTPMDPVVTMQEDPLRMLRAVRFAARFGFVLDPGLCSAMESHAGDLEFVSRERWLMELDEMLDSESGRTAAASVALLKTTGLLGIVLPELVPLAGEEGAAQGPWHHLDAWHHTLAVLEATDRNLDLRWAALLHDAGKPSTRSADLWGTPNFHGHEGTGVEIVLAVAERLRFSKKRRDAVARLVKLHMRPALYRKSWTESAIRRLKRDAGPALDLLMALARADAAALAPELRDGRLSDLGDLEKRLAACRVDVRLLPKSLAPALEKLHGIGDLEGPKMGRLLARLEELVVDGELGPGQKPAYYIEWLERNPQEINHL